MIISKDQSITTLFSDTLIDNPLIKNYQHITEAVARRCSVKNRSEKFRKTHNKRLYRGVSFNKAQVISLQLSEQGHFGAGVSCKFRKIFQNAFIPEQLRATASDVNIS